jgi:hypothetical protein
VSAKGGVVIPNYSSKDEFVRFMRNQEAKLNKPFTDDEKRLSWKVWQQCWNRVRVQLRREMKTVLKQEIKKLKNKQNANEAV